MRTRIDILESKPSTGNLKPTVLRMVCRCIYNKQYNIYCSKNRGRKNNLMFRED